MLFLLLLLPIYSLYKFIIKKIDYIDYKYTNEIKIIKNKIDKEYSILVNNLDKYKNTYEEKLYDLKCDYKILKSIYINNIEQIKKEIKQDIKLENMSNDFIISLSNTKEKQIKVSNLNDMITNYNQQIGSNLIINTIITKKIFEIYSIYSIKCSNIINYRINDIVLNISVSFNLIFENDLISKTHTFCPIILDRDVDYEAKLINKIKPSNNLNLEINTLVKKELVNLSFDPFIYNYLIPILY